MIDIQERGRGRPVTPNDPYSRQNPSAERRLYETARQLRKEFLALSPRAQQEHVEHVLRILADSDQRRTHPSPLARVAHYAYSLPRQTLAWIDECERIAPDSLVAPE